MSKRNINVNNRRPSKKRQTISHHEELKEQLQSDTQKASWEKALAYKEKNMLRTVDKEPYSFKMETKEFGKYGVGLQLFFDFIKFSSILMFVMFLVSIPVIVSNATGDGLATNYPQSTSSYGAWTLANQPELLLLSPASDATDAEITAIETENNSRVSDFVTKMDKRQYWVIIPDIIYTSIFFIFCFAWRRRSKQIKKEAKKQEAIPSHYTVFAEGFPETITDENVYKKHFSQFGHVQEAKIVRNYYGTLFLHKKEATYINKIAIEKRRLEIKGKSESKTLEKLEAKLAKVEENIQQTIEKKLGSVISYDKYPAIGAYIVFNQIKDKQICVKSYDSTHSWCGTKDKRCYFDGKLTNIRPKVDEPPNIKWENLDVGSAEKCGRLTCVFFAVLGVMVATFTIIFIANIVKPTTSITCPTTTYTLAEAQAANDQTITECFCRDQSYTTIQNNAEIKTYCWDVYLEYVSLTLLTFATACVVIIVNFLLKILLRALGRFSKYRTISSETTGITLALFVAMFVNTALITLLLQAEMFGWTPAISITAPVPPLSDLQQKKATEFSADFNRGWYVEVGAKVTVTMLISVFSPHLMFWALIPLFRRSRTKKAKKKVIQKDMNTFITGPQFQVTGYYAAALNTIFVTMFYCSGIPLLLLFAAASLFVQYWVYKYNILRWNKKPPTYDNKLNKKIVLILPFAALMHLAIGIYMYGSPLIFPGGTDQISTSINSSNIAQQTGNNDVDTIKIRLQNQWLMLSALVIMGLIIAADKTVLLILKKAYKFLCCKKKNGMDELNQVHPEGNKKSGKYLFGTYLEEYEGMSARMISSYDIRLNEDYAHLIKAIEIGKEDHEKHEQDKERGSITSARRGSKGEGGSNDFNTPDKSQHQKKHNFNVNEE